MLSELWPRRELILSLVKRDLKTRYKSSILGFLWSFCKPLLLMLVLYVVFGMLVRFDLYGEDGRKFLVPFPLFLLCGILGWSYLLGSVNEGMFSILSNGSLIKKTYIPHEVFPVVSVLSNLFHFILALLVYFILLYLFKGRLTWHVVALPGVILIHTFFVFSLALLLSALNVFYRDIASIMEVVLTAWFYLCPILYPISLLGAPGGPIPGGTLAPWVYQVYMLNPMAPILAAYHKTILLPGFGDIEIETGRLAFYLLIAVINSAILFIIARIVFRHYAGRFADEV